MNGAISTGAIGNEDEGSGEEGDKGLEANEVGAASTSRGADAASVTGGSPGSAEGADRAGDEGPASSSAGG